MGYNLQHLQCINLFFFKIQFNILIILYFKVKTENEVISKTGESCISNRTKKWDAVKDALRHTSTIT